MNKDELTFVKGSFRGRMSWIDKMPGKGPASIWFLIPTILAFFFGCSTTHGGRGLALIGGEPAKPGQFPASIQVHRGPRTGTKCTAIAISNTHILLAAHCLFKYVDGVQQVFGLTMFFSYGVNGESFVIRDIKDVYVPQEAVAFLNEHQTWGAPGVDLSHDVAIIELDKTIPKKVGIGKMSSRILNVGMPFLFGGFGCEDPKFVTGGTDIDAPIRLKYAQGKVTSASNLVAEGLTYDGPVRQSGCQGDSGGPVYFNNPENSRENEFTEYIGINSFHRLKSQGDPVNSENNFSIITTSSVLGVWVNEVLTGKVEPFQR